MSDDLRTYLENHLEGIRVTTYKCGEYSGLMPEDAKRIADRMADAVIRELNLAKACESGCVWQIPNRVEDMTDKQQELLERGDDEYVQ